MSSVRRKVKLAIATVALALANIALYAPPANACMHEACEIINRVCNNRLLFNEDCLG